MPDTVPSPSPTQRPEPRPPGPGPDRGPARRATRPEDEAPRRRMAPRGRARALLGGVSGGVSDRRRADAALVVAAFFFGTTFLVVQDAVAVADPLGFLAVRFLLGAAVLGVVARGRPRRPGELRHGVAAGLALLAAYVLQTVGLQYTDAATSAFLTYLLVVVVPLLGWVVLGRRPHPLTAVAVVLAVGGLALLTGGAGDGIGLGRGEVLTLGSAVGFAVHIVVLGETAGRHDPVRLTCAQLATVGGACLVPAAATGTLALPGRALLAAAFTGVFATALAFLAMVAAQRVVSPARAALVLLLEPVFAAFLGWLTGDPVTGATVAGGLLIVAAVVVAEVLPPVLAARPREAPATAGTAGTAGAGDTAGTRERAWPGPGDHGRGWHGGDGDDVAGRGARVPGPAHAGHAAGRDPAGGGHRRSRHRVRD